MDTGSNLDLNKYSCISIEFNAVGDQLESSLHSESLGVIDPGMLDVSEVI
jgi:hypothetical protein